MAKRELYRQAVALRLKGLSYSEIKVQIPVAKSTLSLWLKQYELTEKQLLRFKEKKELQVERFRNTMRKKRESRMKSYLEEEKKKIFPMTEKEFFLLGLGLYWGEGLKASRHTVSINNTDPTVVRFALSWYLYALKIPFEKIRVQLHLYDDMDIDQELNYWAHFLEVPHKQFSKPWIKESTRSSIDQKGHGHGTCGIRMSNTYLKEHLLMALEAVSEENNLPLL